MSAPVVAARGQARTTAADVTSHAITLPTGIVAGNLLIVVFSVDGAPTCTAPAGWTKLGQATDATNAVTGAVFWKVAAGGDTCTITTSVAEQSSHITFRVTGAASVAGASSSGSSTNSAPPFLALEGAADHLWIATRSGDSTVVATAAPALMTPLTTLAGVGTLSASTNTAEYRDVASTTAEPGTFTSATEQWVSWTLQVHPPNPKISAVTAPFTAALATPPWSPYDANSAFTGGQLVQTIPSGAAGAATLIYGGSRFDATGSAVFCEVVQNPALVNSHYSRPIAVYLPDLTLGASFYLWQGNIYAYHDVLGVLAGPVAYNPVTMRWLQFRVTGTSYYFETSPDAVTWTVFNTGTVASLGIPMTDVVLVFQSSADAAEPQASVARYDNLNIPPGGARAKTSTIVDTFDTQVDPAKWTNKWGTVVWSAGRMAMTEPSGGYSGIAAAGTFDLTDSSFFIQPTPPSTADVSRETTVALYSSATQGIWFVITGNPYSLTMRVKNGTTPDDLSITYDPVAHAFLRVRVVGVGWVYWDTSPDGVTWTQRRAVTTGANLAAVTVELSVGQYAIVAPQQTGYFDNVNAISAPSGGTGRPKVWTGSAHVQKPGKAWTGSAWVEKPWKAWTGTEWKKVA